MGDQKYFPFFHFFFRLPNRATSHNCRKEIWNVKTSQSAAADEFIEYLNFLFCMKIRANGFDGKGRKELRGKQEQLNKENYITLGRGLQFQP